MILNEVIRLAKQSEIYKIMDYIDKNWKKGHILAVNEELFRYEFEMEGRINVAISIDKKGDINGIEGFIPYSQNNKDIMLTLWKVNKTKNPLLGIELFNFIRNQKNVNLIASPGINKKL